MWGTHRTPHGRLKCCWPNALGRNLTISFWPVRSLLDQCVCAILSIDTRAKMLFVGADSVAFVADFTRRNFDLQDRVCATGQLDDPQVGPPTQLAVFDKIAAGEGAAA